MNYQQADVEPTNNTILNNTKSKDVTQNKIMLPECHRAYTDKYFLRTKTILEREGLNPYVRAQVFIRKGPGTVHGLSDAQAILNKFSNLSKNNGAVFSKKDGDTYEPCESLMFIDGHIQDFVELETMYLGVISAATTKVNDKINNVDLEQVTKTMRQIVSLVGERPVIYFGARHWSFDEDAQIAQAAFKGGAQAASTDIAAQLLGSEGSGTIPHALENVMALYYGAERAVVEATLAFDRHIDPAVPRIALVDYNNKEIDDSLATARALGDRLYGVRVDTCGENIAQGALPDLTGEEADKWKAEGLYLPNANAPEAKYWAGHGVTVSGVYKLRKALDRAGFKNVRIVLTSGFGNPEKVKAFIEAEEKLGVKLFDALGVGGVYSPCRAATMDIVLAGADVNNMQAVSKKGRMYRPNPSLMKLSNQANDTESANLETNHSTLAEQSIKKPSSYKVAIAQITTDPGKIDHNTEKCVEQIMAAKAAGAKLVVFPEATIPAYCAMDLLYNRYYIRDNLNALEKIKQASIGITVVIGFVDSDPDQKRPGQRPQLYNSAAIFKDGELLGIQDKTLLPNYEIFFEDRYFSPARNAKAINLGEIKIGVSICEDLWASQEGYEKDPIQELNNQGIDALVNISASPFHIGKQVTRTKLVSDKSQEHNLPCIYANLVGGFDAYEGEVIFDGRSIITNSKGEIIGLGKAFSEDLLLVDLFASQPIEQKSRSEMEDLHDALVLGIKDYIRRNMGGAKKALIGISGGIDSAVVAALAVAALGKENVIGITMPSRFNSADTKNAAYQLAKNLGITIKTLPIQNQVNTVIQELNQDSELANVPPGVAEENVQARLRMIDLMYYGNKLHYIVLNTGNKTELALDNCTIYGDMVGGFSVLGDVDKDRVYALAEFINEKNKREVIPQFTIKTPASAELAENQFDAHVMGDEPQRIAPMLRDIIENNLSLTDVRKKYGSVYSDEILQNVLKRLERSEWKRRQAAPGVRVTAHAFGNGRKVPMAHGYHQ